MPEMLVIASNRGANEHEVMEHMEQMDAYLERMETNLQEFGERKWLVFARQNLAEAFDEFLTARYLDALSDSKYVSFGVLCLQKEFREEPEISYFLNDVQTCANKLCISVGRMINV